MKSFALSIVFAAAIPLTAASQNIGDELNYVASQKQGGELRMYGQGLTYEYYDSEAASTWLYFFDTELVCDKIAIHPETPAAERELVKFLDGSMANPYIGIWAFRRDDGSVLSVERKDGIFVVSEVR